MNYAIIDEENGPKVVQRFATESEAVKWLDNHPDQEKVHRGGFGIDGPCEDEEDDD